MTTQETDPQDRAQRNDLDGLGTLLDAAGVSGRRLAPSPGGRAGVRAAVFDYMAGRRAQGRARGLGREPKSRGR